MVHINEQIPFIFDGDSFADVGCNRHGSKCGCVYDSRCATELLEHREIETTLEDNSVSFISLKVGINEYITLLVQVR